MIRALKTTADPPTTFGAPWFRRRNRCYGAARDSADPGRAGATGPPTERWSAGFASVREVSGAKLIRRSAEPVLVDTEHVLDVPAGKHAKRRRQLVRPQPANPAGVVAEQPQGPDTGPPVQIDQGRLMSEPIAEPFGCVLRRQLPDTPDRTARAFDKIERLAEARRRLKLRRQAQQHRHAALQRGGRDPPLVRVSASRRLGAGRPPDRRRKWLTLAAPPGRFVGSRLLGLR